MFWDKTLGHVGTTYSNTAAFSCLPKEQRVGSGKERRARTVPPPQTRVPGSRSLGGHQRVSGKTGRLVTAHGATELGRGQRS